MAAASIMEANVEDDTVNQPEAADDSKHVADADANDDNITTNDESDSGSDSEEEEDSDDSESDEEEEDVMPDGDSNADLHALLAYSKSRLEKKTEPEASPTPVEKKVEGNNHGDESDDGDESSDEQSIDEGESKDEIVSKDKELEGEKAATTTPELIPDLKNGVSEDSGEAMLEIAKKKLADAEAKAAEDDGADPAHLIRLAEQKVKEAEAKARMDEEATGNVLKPAVTTTRRSDANSELWALLNYSKMRIETGATPQLGKKGTTPTQRDDISVNSKLSKSSKRSLNSKKSIASKISNTSGSKATSVTVEGFPSKPQEEDAPVPDVTSGGASVDGSVSMANSVEEDDESHSSRSDDENDNSDEEEEEEESEDDDDDDDDDDDELPSFLKDDEDDVDPEEARKLYEEAKFKAASILSVSEEKLTDVQMLQAIAIAEEAARTGEDKFSTKRSLFKLSEAKIEDLKSFLDFGENNGKAASTPTNSTSQKKPVGWGIGGGRFVKKVGSLFSDFREKCEELDERKKLEREGAPSNSEILDAAMIDIKKQIEEFESIVRNKAGT